MSSSQTVRTKLSPQVNRIVTALSDRIESDVYKEGEWLPAERALADEFGVSRILIRSAIREMESRSLLDCSAHRRPTVRHRLSLPAGPPPAVETAFTASRSIAIWMWPQRDSTGSASILQGMHESLGKNYRLVLGSATGETWDQIYASEAHFLRQVLTARDIDGVIIGYLGGLQNLDLLCQVRAASVPILFVDHYPPQGFDGDYIGVTNRRSAELAVRHLLALGHRSIAHVSNFDGISTVVERDEGYRRALRSAGIPHRTELTIRDPGPIGGDQRNGLELPLQELLRREDPPTAIFAVNDVTAYRVIAALTVLGIRVPDDISIVGFDGIERWLPTPPFLTTVAQPFEEIGRQAVELLLDRVGSPAVNQYRHVLLEAPLSQHASAAAMAMAPPRLVHSGSVDTSRI